MEKIELSDLSDLSAPGVYEMTTATGSLYQIVINEDRTSTSQRIPSQDGFPLRHDNEVWKLAGRMHLAIGYPGIFELDGMGITDYTIRRTSHVKEIFKIS